MTWRLNNNWHIRSCATQHRAPFPSWFTYLLPAPSVSTSCLSQAPHSSPCPRKFSAKENQITSFLPGSPVSNWWTQASKECCPATGDPSPAGGHCSRALLWGQVESSLQLQQSLTHLAPLVALQALAHESPSPILLLEPTVVGSPGCCDRWPQTRGWGEKVKTIGINSQPGEQKSGIRVQAGWVFSGGLRKEFPCLSWLLVFPSHPWKPLACGCILPISTTLFTHLPLSMSLGPKLPLLSLYISYQIWTPP